MSDFHSILLQTNVFIGAVVTKSVLIGFESNTVSDGSVKPLISGSLHFMNFLKKRRESVHYSGAALRGLSAIVRELPGAGFTINAKIIATQVSTRLTYPEPK